MQLNNCKIKNAFSTLKYVCISARLDRYNYAVTNEPLEGGRIGE